MFRIPMTCRFLFVGLAALTLGGGARAQAPDPAVLVLEDFDGANDASLQRIESGGAAPASFSFADGAYRIQTAAAAQPGVTPARAGVLAPLIDYGRPVRGHVRIAPVEPGVAQRVGVLLCAEVVDGTAVSGYYVGLDIDTDAQALLFAERIDDGVATELFDSGEGGPSGLDVSQGAVLEVSADEFDYGRLYIRARTLAPNPQFTTTVANDSTYSEGSCGVLVEGSAAGGAADLILDDVRLGMDLRANDSFDIVKPTAFQWTAHGDAQLAGSAQLTPNATQQSGQVVSARLGEAPTSLYDVEVQYRILGDTGAFSLVLLDATVHGPDAQLDVDGPAADAITLKVVKQLAPLPAKLFVLYEGVELASQELPGSFSDFKQLGMRMEGGVLSAGALVEGPFFDGISVDLAALGWSPSPLRVGLAGATFDDAGVVHADGARVRVRDVAPQVVPLNVGNGLPTQNSALQLWYRGFGTPGEPFGLRSNGGGQGEMLGLFLGFERIDAPFKGGVLVPFPTKLVLATTDNFGGIGLSAVWPEGVPAGFSIYLQAWVTTPNATVPSGLAASHGLEVRAY